MIQFLADNIDQLDLALDQLAVGDRNFDRFAFMLIDNVIELTLHKFAQDKANENRMWDNINAAMQNFNEATNSERFECKPKYDHKTIEQGLSQAFDNKVKAASKLGLMDSSTCETILYLHKYRNSAYHKGLRHESILHSLAIFYFRNACTLLMDYKPQFWSWCSSDKLSHRSMKYLGEMNTLVDHKKLFCAAYSRLDSIAASMSEDLVGDLSIDLIETIDSIDHYIDFLASEGRVKESRASVVIHAQAWPFAHTEEAKEFAKNNGCQETTWGSFMDWIIQNYKWDVMSDPIPAWRERCKKLTEEKDYHKALKKYCDFMRQTEKIREQINESAAALDMYIQQQIDIMRGK